LAILLEIRQFQSVARQTLSMIGAAKMPRVDTEEKSRHGDYWPSPSSNERMNSILDLSTRFRALKHRNFQLFSVGQLISLVGTWMQTTAQQWLVYQLTGSAALLGVFGFANQVPMLFLAWMGGYVGDRYNRHRGVITTQTISMALAFVLAALTLTHYVNKWNLIFIAFLVGIVNAFDVPIRQSFFVHMVGTDDLPNAIALNSSIFNGARVVGPAIAGFAIALVGEGWCFFLNGVSFIAVLIALLMMRIDSVERAHSGESPVRSFIQGFRFAMSDVPIRSALLLLSVLSFFGLQYSVFLPIYARDILHSGARGFGLLMSAAGVGAVLGALQFAARTQYKGLARWIGATCTACALGLLVFSFATSFWLCTVVLFVVGFAATSQMAATNTIIQQRVPDEMRSRLMAVYATMFMGVMPIGALIAGVIAKHIGAPRTILIFGSAVLAGSLVFISRVVMKVKREEPAPALI
jgi:MFS family permease